MSTEEERKDALRMEYALLERALFASQSGILITDAGQFDNPIIWCNPGFVRLTGYTYNEILGRNCRFLQGAGTDPKAVAKIREAVENPEPVQVLILNYRKDGTPFWNDLNISPVRDELGQVTHFIGVQSDVSHARALPEDVERARQYAQYIVDTVREPMLILDDDLRVTAANLSFYQTFAATHSETENVALYELGNGQWNIPVLRRLLEEILPQNQVIRDFPVTHRFPQIGTKTMLLNARAIAAESGFPARILLAMEDVTHRLDTLQDSVAFARSIIDSLTAHIAILDETGTIVTVNAAWNDFARQNGVQNAEERVGVGKNYLKITEASQGDGSPMARYVAVGIRSVIERKQSAFEFEYPCHAPEERRWFLMRVTRFEYGGRTYIVVAHENITQRKLSEEALRLSEANYRLAVDTIPQIIWLARPDGTFESFHPRLTEYTGLALSQLISGGWESFLHPDDWPATETAWKEAMATGEKFETEFRIPQAADGYRWQLASALPQRDENGKILHWFGTLTDINELKQAEDVLRRHQREIESLNERLKRAVQETHHRVKNNLQVVNALLELPLVEGRREVPAPELERITRHINALATIHDLLTMQARTNATADTVPASSVLERLLALLLTTNEHRKLTTEVADIALPLQKATALAVLVNELVSNAIKHTDGSIRVRLTQTDGFARLEVHDEGSGFPTNFDPRKAANTGLELIESAARWDLRGDVVYENNPEGGARVVVTFPLEKS